MSASQTPHPAQRRVWARLPDGTREALDGLSTTDLQTLLLSVAHDRAARVRPADLLRRWRQDRLVRPAAVDPRRLAAVEDRLWHMLPARVDGVELSPLVPLGTASALGPVSQNRVVTTARTAEVLSDSTNALAIEAAARRLRQPASAQVHLAASHRQLRAQQFGPGLPAHFRLFALVSSSRDVGSGRTEAALLTLHLAYWQRVLSVLAPTTHPRLRWTTYDNPVIRERVNDTVLPALAGESNPGTVELVEEPNRQRGRGYYVGAALRITAGHGDEETELGDGGFTTWTAQLMGDAKERCLISCIATERLTHIVGTCPNLIDDL